MTPSKLKPKPRPQSKTASRPKRKPTAKKRRRVIPARPGGKRARERGPEALQLLKRVRTRIKDRRIELQITAAELAAAIDITTSIQFVREAGGLSMPLEDLARYAKALRCKPADLVK
jgi:ribosome-binding protein aMBF1 (putative translation factor)